MRPSALFPVAIVESAWGTILSWWSIWMPRCRSAREGSMVVFPFIMAFGRFFRSSLLFGARLLDLGKK